MKKSHGMTYTPTYEIWWGMISRCYNKNRPTYKRYGGRGIKVCDRWRHSFENFYLDMGERPPNLTLERKNGNKNYSPDNCCWASRKQQAINRKTTHWITFKEKTLPMNEWANIIGMRRETLRERLKRGWSITESLTKPVRMMHFKRRVKR